MPIKDDREYRNFQAFNIETRASEDGGDYAAQFVEGYASTFEEYTLWEYQGANSREVYKEKISPDAFQDADLSDVVFLRDHTGQVLARTKNGLVKLSVDDTGLFTSTDLSKTEAARAMFEDIRIENYTQMSFAFRVAADEWTEERTDGVVTFHRNITKIAKVYDISAVSFPANPTTDISPATRAAFDGAIERLRAERLEAEARQQEQARKIAEIKIKLMEAAKHD